MLFCVHRNSHSWVSSAAGATMLWPARPEWQWRVVRRPGARAARPAGAAGEPAMATNGTLSRRWGRCR
ncbi:MAG: hypothetical protein QOH40_3035 [Arthrobacter pascens]|nr:hypothetical protein [Arthrobacter pascens]